MISVREKKFIPYNNITQENKTVFDSITVYNNLIYDFGIEKITE